MSEPKSCTQIPCPPFTEVSLHIVLPDHVPTVAELRQAGTAMYGPDGGLYSLHDGEVVQVE